MKRFAYVARTAYDLDHVNRLRAPHFSVVELYLTIGGRRSKTYFPEWAPAPTAPAAGSDDFHFVPEKETLDIAYEIDNKLALVSEAKLELFCRFQKKPLWSVDLAELGEDALLHGKHVLKWDGRVGELKAQAGKENGGAIVHELNFEPDDDVHDDFPDGYVTLEHTPYKLKLTLKAEENDELVSVAWTYFHIIVKSLVLELGPEEAIPSGWFSGDRYKMDVDVYSAIKAAGGVPAFGAAAARRIQLPSNLFKDTSWFGLVSASREMNDETAYNVYKKQWDDGPKVPIIAKIRLSASDGSEVKLEDGPGAKALGNTRFLWDWEDVPENVGVVQSQPSPTVFITNAVDYDKATTKPKGDNCHVDRGGKRGTDAEPVFPKQSGYSPRAELKKEEFPFEVEASETRKWAAYSRGWTKGKLMGCTGVLFRPSRMAGDSYRLGVYVAWDRTAANKLALDVDTEPLTTSAAIKVQSGVFEVWREIHLVRYIRKSAAIPDFVAGNLPAVRAPFNQAYIEVIDKTPADKYLIPAADYNTNADAALKKADNQFIDDQLFVSFGANHHAGTSSEFLTNNFATFTALLPAWLAAQGIPLAPAAWLAAKGLGGATAATKYTNLVSKVLQGPAVNLIDKLKTLDGAKDGITIIEFQFVHSTQAALMALGGIGLSVLNGAAVDVPGASRNKCCFAFWNPMIDTFAHEIGHHMFLPHAPDGVPPQGGPQPERHDSADTNCMMSYNRPRISFCGLCQLRLRGWDAGPNDAADAKLKKTSAANKKP